MFLLGATQCGERVGMVKIVGKGNIHCIPILFHLWWPSCHWQYCLHTYKCLATQWGGWLHNDCTKLKLVWALTYFIFFWPRGCPPPPTLVLHLAVAVSSVLSLCEDLYFFLHLNHRIPHFCQYVHFLNVCVGWWARECFLREVVDYQYVGHLHLQNKSIIPIKKLRKRK